jgi:C1A family cysteine protease/acylphosphatase
MTTTVGIDLEEISKQISAQGAAWTSGETSMTRLTQQEARKRLGLQPPPGAPSIDDIDRMLRQGQKPKDAFVAAAAVGAPSGYDWRNVNGQNYVTPIRDQGGCGSCVAFGVVGVLECTLRIAQQNPGLDVDLSEAQLFFCYGRSHGATCSTGWSPDAALDDCTANGLAFESSYPYTAVDQNCSNLNANWKARYVTLSGKNAVSGAAIKDWISRNGPVTGCFTVYADFYSYSGGVYKHVSGAVEGGHCVAIVGYDDTQSCWICKNSWGTSWGESGFFRIGYGECGIDTWIGPYGASGLAIAEQPKAWSGWASLGGVLTTDIAVFENADGRLEIFARGTDNAVWHNWQTAPNGGWSGWASLGGVVLTAPAVGRNNDGRLEVFAKGTDGAVWHNWQTAPNGGWSGWASLGGVITSEITVASNADGRLEVFVRGTDNAVWHNWQTAPSGGWSGWNSLGGVITSDICVGRNADGRLEIFAKGTDGAVWHNWQTAPNGGWSGWASLGGVITSDIAVGQNADGRLELFVRGTDNALWHDWQTAPNGGWSGWASLGGVLTSNIGVGRSPGGRLEAFVRGTDNALWHKWQVSPNGAWSDWASEGGVLTSDIAVASNADGRLEVFALGTDRAVWHDWQTQVFAAPAPAARERAANTKPASRLAEPVAMGSV